MATTLYGFGFTCLTAGLAILADTLLKHAAVKGELLSLPVAIGCLLYVASALLWFGAVRHISLAQAGVAYGMITLVALAIVGMTMFGEPMSRRHLAGVVCALCAMGLMIRA
ncbi:hypothetical protein HKCCE3408_08490 [Rhodobacterales bacterium HKCCE3408]|nr:hypothetical protein [Rhodobacterales bacterium HKCCE3408]